MNWRNGDYISCDISELKGKTILRIDGAQIGNDRIDILCSDESHYIMYHVQDCCESVEIQDIYGNIEWLIGNPIIMAEDISELSSKLGPLSKYDESYTWTWYKFATLKGYVTIRWYGESNGYYSEDVDFVKQIKEC